MKIFNKKRKKSIMLAKLYITIVIKKAIILAIILSQKLVLILITFVLITNIDDKKIVLKYVSCIYYFI